MVQMYLGNLLLKGDCMLVFTNGLFNKIVSQLRVACLEYNGRVVNKQ